MFNTNPKRALQKVTSVVEVHQTTVWQCLHIKLKIFPYLLQVGQHLFNAHKQSRIDFAHYSKQKMEKDPNFFGGINIFDDSTFSLGGAINNQN